MFRSYLIRACASSLLLASGVALSATSTLADQSILDGSGRDVKVSDTSRILSVGGDVTEILYALRADDKIIAIDSTSQFPGDALQKKTDVGYLRALSAEGVLSTNPSVIIASSDAGPPPVIEVLKSSSVPYVVVPDDKTPEGVANKIRFIAKVVGLEAAGEALAKDVERDFALLAEQRAKITKPKRALFVLSVQSGKATIGGAGTGADAMIQLAGAVNAGASVPGYKPLTDESGVELAPDAILTMQHGGGGMPGDRIKTVPSLAGSPAMKNGEIIEMNGLYLLGFGPRCARAARELMAALYPELVQKKASAAE
ncbi:Periplasmic hemin-binding protein [Hyphomicrobium sulfonivorans]|uniref:Periplasmic hemin-binding protein n=1 Tax=Hyphomicrobium sulfonivorans TaxID=121290 RepID=A0A109BCF7_HYPSL|nr:ABC transporter substrate-binding protein [Hyphomicrobium sulfonivorans]KWT66186.1 Periplasmic hemin-binding protein [Hyphomicrobium sulfonivorans]